MSDLSPARTVDLDQAVRNAAAFWVALATARGHTLVQRPGFLAAGGDGRIGQRILLLRPDPSPDDMAELTEIARRPSAGPVTVEDAFNVVDMSGVRLNPRQLPVMIRRPGPAPAPSTMKVIRVGTADELATAEQVMVDGFPIETAQPYRRGEALPADLLSWPGFDVFLVEYDGATAGACVLVVHDGVAGLYWVVTLPEFRSRGVGRALMHAVLDHVEGIPVTLSAARAGKPLYDSLDFETITLSAWWS
jgi:GNAT superfamily N-acetyltransferase